MKCFPALAALMAVATPAMAQFTPYDYHTQQYGFQGYQPPPVQGPTFINPNGGGGYTIQPPSGAPTFVYPNGGGGYTAIHPNGPPSFAFPTGNGGMMIMR